MSTLRHSWFDIFSYRLMKWHSFILSVKTLFGGCCLNVKVQSDRNLHIKRLPGGPLGFGFDNCHNIITLRETDGEKQTEKGESEFLLHPIYRTSSALKQNSKDFVFYFLQFVYLASTTKRKVSIPCFIPFPKPLTLLYSWQDFASGCVLKISAIVWCIDPFVVVIPGPKGKDTEL